MLICFPSTFILPVKDQAKKPFPSESYTQNEYLFSIILVEFCDVMHTIDRNDIQMKLNSLAEYIKNASYGLYQLDFYLTEQWYQLPENMSTYDNDLWLLLRDSINYSDSEVKYQEQSRIMIIHAGNDEALSGSTDDIRSQYYNVHCGAPIKTKEGTLISSTIIVAENDPLGAFVHEFLHILGAFDLYGGEGERGHYVGSWDVMATGWNLGSGIVNNSLFLGECPSQPSSWTKNKVGWFRESDIILMSPGNQTVEILPLEDQSEGIHVIKIPVSSTIYFLIEVREKKDFDSYLPDAGFLVFICNEEASDVYGGIISLIDATQETETLDDAAFKSGEEYVDGTHHLSIEFQKKENKYFVNINYRAPNLVMKDLGAEKKEGVINLRANVTNDGDFVVEQSEVFLFVNGILVYKNALMDILPNNPVDVCVSLPMQEPLRNGENIILWQIQTIDDVIEYNETDNEIHLYYTIYGIDEKSGPEWKQVPSAGGYATSFDIGDLTGDQKQENIYALSGYGPIYIIGNNGTLLKRFEWDRAYIYDVDGDGTSEILLVNDDSIMLTSLEVGGINWTRNINLQDSGIESRQDKIEFYDVNNDDIKDIIILSANDRIGITSIYGGSLSYYKSLNVYVISGSNGEFLYNFTVTQDKTETFEFTYFAYLGRGYIGDYGIVDVEDINKDGIGEILIGLIKNDFEQTGWYNTKAYVFYLYSVNGSLLWRKEIETSPGMDGGFVSVFDYNNDNNEEILFTSPEAIHLIDSKGNILWKTSQEWIIPPVSGNIKTINGNIIVFSSGSIFFIDSKNGTVVRTISSPNGESINTVYSTALIQNNIEGNTSILLSTDNGFYILYENGEIETGISFNTYSWFNIIGEDKAVVYALHNNSIYIADLFLGKISKLFETMHSGTVLPVNLDDDPDPEYMVYSSILLAYDSDGSLKWAYGLGAGGTYSLQSVSADLNNDGSSDAIFFKGDFQKSFVLFKTDKIVYDLEDCVFSDINNDTFSEVITVGDRGLEVYDIVGNLIWNVPGADFRLVNVGDLINGRKIIAVSVGIFAQYIGLSPQVRIYTDTGRLIKVIGSYWDPPYFQIIKSSETNKEFILIVGPWGRGEYHLEFYDITGRQIFDRLVSEDVYGETATLTDVNNDKKEEIVIPPFVFTIDGELLKNNYPENESEQYIQIQNLDDNGQKCYIDSSYPFALIKIRDVNKNVISEISLQEFNEVYGVVAVKSGCNEITFFISTLTSNGYSLIPVTYYYVQAITPYGSIEGSGFYKKGENVSLEVPDTIIDLENGTRRVFTCWTGATNSTSSHLYLQNVDSGIVFIVNWKTQFYLDVTEYGVTTPSGWYDKGSIANISIISSFISGFPFNRYFIGWRGDVYSNETSISVLLDSPKNINAIWSDDGTPIIYSNIIMIVISISIVIFVRYTRRVSSKHSNKNQLQRINKNLLNDF